MAKKPGLSKTLPKSEARPLGTPAKHGTRRATPKPTDAPTTDRPQSEHPAAARVIAYTEAVADEKKIATSAENPVHPTTNVVDSDHTTTPTAISPSVKETHMATTLTLKGLNKKGTVAYYTGTPQSQRFPLANFANKTAPPTIELPGDIFVAKTAKPKMTAEERKAARLARPKPTIAEKIEKQRQRLARLEAEAAKAQPAEALSM